MATPQRKRATSSTTRSKKTGTTPAQETTMLSSSQGNNVEAEIRFRAYQLFVQRGRTHGADLEDWLRAETEVRQNVAV